MNKIGTILVFHEPDNLWKSTLSGFGASLIFIPVLSFDFINSDELSANLQKLGIEYDSLIVTSPRSANAINARMIQNPSIYYNKDKKFTCFAVGPKTMHEVKTTFADFSEVEFIGGKDAGNASALLAKILSYYGAKSPEIRPRTSFFPCGNLRKPIIPSGLEDARIKFKELIVYKTLESPNFDKIWSNFCASIQENDEKGAGNLIAVISSGSCLRIVFDKVIKLANLKYRDKKLLWICLGQSIANEVRERMKNTNIEWSVYTSEEPNPKSVKNILEGIE